MILQLHKMQYLKLKIPWKKLVVKNYCCILMLISALILQKPSVAMNLLKEMEDNASNLEVSHSPFGWTKSYKIQVKGHPLAESSKSLSQRIQMIQKPDEEITSDALKGESKIRSYWKILSPDGTMTNIGDF